MSPPIATKGDSVTIEDSKMRFRSVVAIVGSIVTVGATGIVVAWKISGNVTSTMAAVETAIHEQGTAIQELKDHTYTLERASEQALRMAISNPGMKVPDPRDPNKIIEVDRVKSTSQAEFEK